VDKLDLLLTYLIHCNSKLLDIDKTDLSGQSPLHLAVKLNDIWSAKVLICFGADINSTNRTLQTPLDIVTERLQITESNEHEELHELLTLLHAVPGGWSAKSRSRLFNESLNSLVNESYEIEDQVQLGVYLDERRLAAFVFKLEELLQRQNLEFSVNNGISLPPGHLDAEGTFFDAMISRQNQILRIKEWKSTLEFKRGAGSRMLFLDGGGIRGLIQIELLSCIEKVTGKRITELFDWIIGTSTGGILALGLVYLGMSLAELRQLYFQLRENVFAGGMLSVARRTEALEQILKEQFKNKKMCDVDYPKLVVVVFAVSHKLSTLYCF
jgi:calcium-independent phospholipase A2